MIAETIHDRVPKWPMSSNQLGFYRYDQIAFNATENHKPTPEMVNLQIGSLLYASGMFS
jgi:hypothetical protein